MSFFRPDSLRSVTGGRWIQAPPDDAALRGIGIDSRADLTQRAFVAIRGDRHDGHDFIEPAAGAGARLLVVERPPERLPLSVGVVLVDDTRAALARLAAAYRATLSGTTVIGVTGSCGKTTVKHLIDTVLSTSWRGSAAPGSFNNDIGLPLAILAADPADDYLILEVGANRPGEIDHLSSIARPDIGVITMIGRAHLEGFGTIETVAREKAKLLRHLRGRRVGIVNADAPALRDLLERCVSTTLFGEADDADLRLTRRGHDEGRWWLEINGRRRFEMRLPGRHNAVNALAAVAVAEQFAISDERIAEALGRCEPVSMRMTRHEQGGITIYNDAYNANPDSVIASLETFSELAAGARRRVVVLGDMRELGAAAGRLHREIAQHVLEVNGRVRLDRVFTVGKLAAAIAAPVAEAFGKDRVVALDGLSDTSAEAIAATLRPGDAILLKASRAIGLERIADALHRVPGAKRSVPQVSVS